MQASQLIQLRALPTTPFSLTRVGPQRGCANLLSISVSVYGKERSAALMMLKVAELKPVPKTS
jgi:hypothetical protein